MNPAGLDPRPQLEAPLSATAGYWQRLRGDWLFWSLLALVALLALLDPWRIPAFPALVDWHTIALLAGLLILTRGLEESGALHGMAHAVLARVRTERSLALVLVLIAAGLATVITNDVALFVVVPMTLSLRAHGEAPVAKLVIFQALAVNAGSALTPIGNPQNIFLWQFSGAAAGGFVLAMLPVVAVMMAGLVFLTFVAFRPRPLAIDPRRRRALERPLLAVSLALYIPFLLLAGAGRSGLGLLVVFTVFAWASRTALMRVDWPLLAIFALMFIAFRLVADLAFLRTTLGGPVLADPLGLFLAGAALSQFVSNVPAAIVLAEYSADWRAIAWGVSIGGFGTAVASLANIIALRMLGEWKAWWLFHLYAVPFLLATGLAAGVLLWRMS